MWFLNQSAIEILIHLFTLIHSERSSQCDSPSEMCALDVCLCVVYIVRQCNVSSDLLFE